MPDSRPREAWPRTSGHRSTGPPRPRGARQYRPRPHGGLGEAAADRYIRASLACLGRSGEESLAGEPAAEFATVALPLLLCLGLSACPGSSSSSADSGGSSGGGHEHAASANKAAAATDGASKSASAPTLGSSGSGSASTGQRHALLDLGLSAPMGSSGGSGSSGSGSRGWSLGGSESSGGGGGGGGSGRSWGLSLGGGGGGGHKAGSCTSGFPAGAGPDTGGCVARGLRCPRSSRAAGLRDRTDGTLDLRLHPQA